MKIDVRDVMRNVATMCIIPICVRANGHIFEIHVVFCEGACLIAKNMLNLAQLLIQGTCLNNNFRRFRSLKS